MSKINIKKIIKGIIQTLVVLGIILVFYTLLREAKDVVTIIIALFFAVYNSIPFFLAFYLISSLETNKILVREKYAIIPIIMFCVINVFMISYFNLSWIFNWNEIATSSSTSALMFAFLPIYSNVISAIVSFSLFGIIKLFLYLRDKRNK